MVLRSLEVFRRIRDMVGGESGYVGCGVLIGVSAAMRPKLEETVMRQRSLGVRADVLEPADLTSVEPRINPEISGPCCTSPSRVMAIRPQSRWRTRKARAATAS